MLLEMLPTHAPIHLHIRAFMCKNETYRKIASDFSMCLIAFFQNGVDFFQNGAEFFQNGIDFLKNLGAFFSWEADF